MEQKKDGLFFNAFEGLDLDSTGKGGGDHPRKKRKKDKTIVDPFEEQEARQRRLLEELVVIGYESRLFRNDRQAESVERGEHLIPWMGRTDLLIDRYDARALLTDLLQFDRRAGGWDAKHLARRASRHDDDDPQRLARERLLEQKLDRERYWDMVLHAEDIYKEEEQKRQKMQRDNAYGNVALDYGEIIKQEEEEEKQRYDAEKREKERQLAEAKCRQQQEEAKQRAEEEKYEPPHPVPEGVIAPVLKKMGLIIEKTAKFIFSHGPEAVSQLKEKQKDNPMFLFLVDSHPLNAYLNFFIGQLEEARKREEEERGKAQEFACSLVSEYNDEEEPFKEPTDQVTNQDDTRALCTQGISEGYESMLYVALYDFTPEREGETSMKAGEVLRGHDTVDGWLLIERDEQAGYVPRGWVRRMDKPKEEVAPSENEKPKPPDDEKKMKRVMRAKLLAQLLTTGKEDIAQQLCQQAAKERKREDKNKNLYRAEQSEGDKRGRENANDGEYATKRRRGSERVLLAEGSSSQTV